LFAEVSLEEHLHGEFAGFAAGTHSSKDRLSEFFSRMDARAYPGETQS
jgi:hypothetical protein